MAMTASNGYGSSFESPPVSPASSFAPRFGSAIRGQNSPFPTTPMSTTSAFFDPPPGTAYADFIRTWTDAHVARWLTDIKCANHAAAFRANDIRGDILLELDQTTLVEMGVSSIGDRLRIINAVKSLRQRSASRTPPTPIIESMRPLRLDMSPDVTAMKQERTEGSPTTRLGHRKLESGRPAPLQLSQSSGRNDNLPRLVREQPDSARITTSSNNSSNNNTSNSSSSSSHPVRPLPRPSQQTQSNSGSGSGVNSARANLPPLPPPPQSQPPLPPPSRQPARGMLNGGSQLAGRRTPTPDSYTSQPLPPAPQQQSGLLTPSSGSWSGYHLPADPRPGNAGSNGKTPGRSTSPLIPGRAPPRTSSHGRGTSLGNNSPGPSSSPSPKPPVRSNTGNHPYATSQPSALQAPLTNPAYNLSPIEESFNQSSSAGSPPSFSVGRGPFNTPTPGTPAPSLDDLRRKLVRFLLPEEGLSFTVDIGNCAGGIEVLEKVLKKFGKGGSRSGDGGPNVRETEEGGLSVDGWGVYLDLGQEDGPGEPLSEAELLSVCHAPPNHPVREHGLTLRRTGLGRRGNDNAAGSSSPNRGLSTGATSKATKRASSISILSGLGVHDPERALEPPSPTVAGRMSPTPSAPPSPPLLSGKKRPGKLHNFFGQRPPSELITDHLTEYFPMTDKKVLARTARQSMIFRNNTRSKRDSTASWNPAPPLPSRFSSSTQGSAPRTSMSSTRTSFSSHAPPPPLPDSRPSEDIPRVSLSTEDGRSVDLHSSDGSASSEASNPATHPQLLPPIPFPTESFSESLESITGPGDSRVSRSLSTASRRMSYMTEVRSKRDRTDTASMLTVDEITADLATDRSEEEWTKVESEDGLDPDNGEDTLNNTDEDEEEDDEMEDPEEDTLNDPDAEDDDSERPKSEMRIATKWIKGALIGAGSFGKVYLGMDASTGLLMAVKQVELPTTGTNQERKKSMLTALEREIELLKELQHENIVQYLYSSLDDDFLNIFLEYVPGGSVTALLNNYGAFEEPLVKNFVRQILEGLNYLHERDIIHRDIKGANILVDNKGGVKISDFGISKKVDDMGGNRAHRPSLQGSVFWMAPEVVKQSGHTRKADIWSVGCLVVEMLTGEHPWATLNQMQAMFKIGSSAKPEIPSDISSDAQDFLKLTFELNHEARPSAAELLLHPWVGKKPVVGKKG